MAKSLLSLFFIIFCSFLSHAQPEMVWKFETEDRIYSSPLIQDDLVFAGSGDHSFYAIHKKTGEKAWEFKTEGAVHSSPSIYGELVYFGSTDGNLYALDKNSGELAWKYASEGEKMYDLWDYYLSTPQANEGVIYWGSGDGNLYAIDGKSGKLKWKFQTGDILHASPVISGEHVFIGGFDGYFYSIHKKGGELAWKFKTVGDTYFPKGEIQKAALVKDETVYFGSRDYNIYALDAKTGRGKWNMKQPNGWIIATPIEYKGNIYFGTSDAHLFYCMDQKSGKIIWEKHLNMRVYGTACIEDSIVYFGTFDGKLLGVDYLSGETKWEFQTEASKSNYSTIYNEKGHFRSDFQIYGNEYEASEKKIQALGSILSSPVINEGIIYFGSSDGNLYAVKLK